MTPQEEIAEQKIRDALAQGEDRELPGKGKPIDLDAYFATPEGWRMGHSVLRSANVLPEELELFKEIRRLEEAAETAADEAEKRRLRRSASELRAVYEIKMQRFRKGNAL